MNLLFKRDITKNDQDGLSYLCTHNNEEVTVTISRTAFLEIGIDINDTIEEIMTRLNTAISNSFRILDDDEILEEITIVSNKMEMKTNRRRLSMYGMEHTLT